MQRAAQPGEVRLYPIYDLHEWVMELLDFEDDLKRPVEKILEAIQAVWIEEVTESG